MAPPTIKYIKSDGTDRPQQIELRTNQHHHIILQRPPIWSLDPPGLYYETNGIVWLPIVSLTSSSITALDALRAVFDYSEQQSGVRLLIAGHADAIGSEAANTALSRERAELVMMFLIGDRTAWAAACVDRDTVSIWQHVLTWATLFLGWDCHPGEIDNDLGPQTEGALESFRSAYNESYGASLPVKGGFSGRDWEAVFDLYEATMARLLAVSLDGLAELRDRLRFTIPAILGCGESFPTMFGDPEQALLWNRRVDLVFCKGDHLPALDSEPPGSTLYKGWVRRTPIPVEPRAVEPLGRLWFVMLSECGQEPIADLEFVLVRGGRQIKGRTDERGIYDGGPVLSARYELLIGDDRVVCPTIDLDDLDPYPLYFYPEITAEARAATGETPDEDEAEVGVQV